MAFSVLPRPHPVDVKLHEAQKHAGQRFNANIRSITPARPPKPSPPPPPPVEHLANFRAGQADRRRREADEQTAMMQSRISTRVLLNQAAAAAAATQSTSTPTATSTRPGHAYSFLQNSPQHALTQQLREASLSGSTVPAATLSTSTLPMQLQLSPHVARVPPAEVSQLQFESWEAETSLSREMDEEAIHLFLQIEAACVHLTRELQIRVEKWVLKLSALLTTTLSIQRDRELYLRLLLDQVQKRNLAFPFDRAPDDKVALARLPLYMNLAKPTQTRNKSWHQVLHNLSATFLQSCAARARGAPAGTTGAPASVAEGSNAAGGPLQQSREEWVKYFHYDPRSPLRPTRRGSDHTPVDRLESNPQYNATNPSPFAPWNSPPPVGAPVASSSNTTATTAQLSPQPLQQQQPGAPPAHYSASSGSNSGNASAESNLEMTHSFSPAVHPHRAVGSFDAGSASGVPARANAAGFVGDVVFANMEREAALARQQTQQLAQQHGGEASQHQAQASSQAAIAATTGSEASFRPFASENETLRTQRDAARAERDELRALLGESEYLVSNLLVERDALKKSNGLLSAQLAAAREEPDFESMVREMHALRRARDQAEETLLQREAQLADLKNAAAEREQQAMSQLLAQRKGGNSATPAASSSAFERPYSAADSRSSSSLFASPAPSNIDATMRRAAQAPEGSAYADRRSYDLDSTKIVGSPDSYPISYSSSSQSHPASAARDRAERSAFSPPIPRASPPQRHTREPSSFDMLMAEQARLTGSRPARPAAAAAWYPSESDLHDVLDTENPSSSFRSSQKAEPDGSPVSPLRIDVRDPRSSDLEEEEQITLEGSPQPVSQHPSHSRGASAASAASTSPGKHNRTRSGSRIPVLRSTSPAVAQPQQQQRVAHSAHSTWAPSDAAAALEQQQQRQQALSPSRRPGSASSATSLTSSSSPSRRSTATNPVGENGHHIAGIAAATSPAARSRSAASATQKRVTPDGEIVVSPAARTVPPPVEDQEVFAQYARHFQRETQALLSASRNGRKPRESRESTEAQQRELYGQHRVHDEEGAPDSIELHTHI